MNNKLSSGSWRGFYIYGENANARNHNMTMDVTIEGEVITIRGIDDVGDFVCKGVINYESGEVFFFKRYRTHEVFYKGRIAQDGITGTWKLNNTSGIFYIWKDPKSRSVHRLKEKISMKGTSKRLVRKYYRKEAPVLYN